MCVDGCVIGMVCAGWWGWSHLYWSSGEDDGQSEGRDDDAGGDEVGQLPAGVTGAVVAVPPGQHAGDGTEQVEDDDCEGIPVAGNITIRTTPSLSLSLSLVLKLRQSTGQEEKHQSNRSGECQTYQS